MDGGVDLESISIMKANNSSSRSVIIVVAALVVVLVYAMSYAPFVWLCQSRMPPGSSDWVAADGWTFYKPIDWLFDNTKMLRPLLWWADVWGVGENFVGGQFRRELFKAPP